MAFAPVTKPPTSCYVFLQSHGLSFWFAWQLFNCFQVHTMDRFMTHRFKSTLNDTEVSVTRVLPEPKSLSEPYFREINISSGERSRNEGSVKYTVPTIPWNTIAGQNHNGSWWFRTIDRLWNRDTAVRFYLRGSWKGLWIASQEIPSSYLWDWILISLNFERGTHLFPGCIASHRVFWYFHYENGFDSRT